MAAILCTYLHLYTSVQIILLYIGHEILYFCGNETMGNKLWTLLLLFTFSILLIHCKDLIIGKSRIFGCLFMIRLTDSEMYICYRKAIA